jgi:Xaa-Pro aminopeptidase
MAVVLVFTSFIVILHAFTHSFIHPFIHSFTHPFIHCSLLVTVITVYVVVVQCCRQLAPGCVITIEPGLYIPDEERYGALRGIGVRIEDDVLVTQDGCEVSPVQALAHSHTSTHLSDQICHVPQ